MTLKEDRDLIRLELSCERLSGEPPEPDALEALDRILAEVEALDAIEAWLFRHHDYYVCYSPAIHGGSWSVRLESPVQTHACRLFLVGKSGTRLDALTRAAKWCEANP